MSEIEGGEGRQRGRRPSSVGTGRVPAIVLTCDRYHPLSVHMIRCYELLWPSHPFTFYVPYQRRPLEGARVVARPTHGAIRSTVLELLDEFDDEAWVYWSIDDKYPIRLVQPAVTRLAEAVLADALVGVDGVLFCRCRKLLLSGYLQGERRAGPGGVTLLRRTDYSQIWIHQFVRAKVIRHLFRSLPDPIPHAKSMDAMLPRVGLPPDHRLYVVETNLAVFGESTVRGRVTRNCAASLRAHGLGVPAGFEETDGQSVMGVIDGDPERPSDPLAFV